MGILGKAKAKLHSEEARQRKGEILWLWNRAVQFRSQILMVCLLALAGTVMGLGSAVASKYLIDAVTGQSGRMILNAAALMAVMTLGAIGLQALSSRVGASVHVKVKNQMQHMTYSRILRAGWEALEPYRSGDLLNRLNADVNVISDGIINLVPGALSTLVRFAGAFVIMLYFDPVMACIALAGVPVTLLMSRYLMERMRQHNLQMKELTGEVMSFQEDSFRNLTSIKAFSITEQFVEEMGRLQGTYADAYLSFNGFKIGMSSLLALVSTMVSGCCFGWGVYQLWTGAITFGSLTMFLQLASTLRAAFSSLVGLVQQTVGLTTSAGRIMAVEDLPAEATDVPEALARERDLAIRLKNISFEYQNGDVVLEPFDFSVEPGDLVAITGPSGEGKTTLLRLLLGLVSPCGGEARLEGQGTTYPINAGSRCVFAYVPQGNSVFSGTVGDNLRLVRPDATDKELEAALEAACALDFVKQFPDGLDHPLGAGGRGISEGQAQRLAIARALLRRAPILLLDEATSTLDVATEQRILDNLRTQGWVRTCILVTHRPASAEICGRAYEICRRAVTEVRHGS